MIRMQIQFTEAQAATLRLESQQRGMSIASIVRERVDAKKPIMPSRAAAFAGFGSGRSGITDLAENHNDYVEADWIRE
ncbi:MAG: hypothetical protein H7287_12920 [Thermoleophilia bacterium]|nr:hypothetical protein [Thermoleophilia bacterium]